MSAGYIYEKHIGHPLATKHGLVLQHRKVWFDNFGEIPNGCVIHHKNGIKTDNRIENLELLTRSAHMKEHYNEGLGLLNGEAEYVKLTCGICQSEIVRKKWMQKVNAKNTKTKLFIPTCSRSCLAKLMNMYRYKKIDQINEAEQRAGGALKEQP